MIIDMFNRSPEISSDKCIIIVFTGGMKAVQIEPFTHAIGLIRTKFNKMGIELIVEMIGIKEVSEKRWDSHDLIDWLLASNIHFVLSHIHQGCNTHNLIWNKPLMLKQLERLKYHRGFPTGQQLSCPVFTQNKGGYLRALPSNMINPTLIINLREDGRYDKGVIDELKRYK